MGSSDLKPGERWGLLVSGIQALATVGMFVVAVFGITKVAPIITYQTYQIEQKQQKEETEKQQEKQPEVGLVERVPRHSPSADRFVKDVLDWWTHQVEGYQKIMDLIRNSAKQKTKITYRVVAAKQSKDEAIPSPDFLVVTATSATGKRQTIKVAVNERAMNPNQYIQCKINQGMLYDMAEPDRQRVEMAITRYINEGMVNKVPPAYVQSDMTLRQLDEAISYHQQQRVEAIRQIKALEGVIDASLK